MSRKRIEDVVLDLVSPVVEKNKFELVDVEFVKEGANWYLRIYIDKPEGITLDDCQAVSEGVSEVLDRVDPIQQSYFLEVSSPGLDRPLKKDRDFEKYKGEPVEVKVFQAIDGKKVFEGELVGLIDDKVCIRPEGTDNILEFERDKIATVKRAVKF